MGMTNRQWQGVIRMMIKILDNVLQKESKEEIISDISSVRDMLQSMLEDGTD